MVFSNPEVVRRVNADFIPVALKAGLVNSPPPGIEGALYAEIGRSKPAPQGICVANSAGRVLSWTLSFDTDASILDFLDYVTHQYQKHPDTDIAVPAKRFMRFPSQAMADVADDGKVVAFPDRHGREELCPAQPVLRQGTLTGRIVGRALDGKGNPLAETLHQEHYMESTLTIPAATQELLAQAARNAAGELFRIPGELARTLVSQAFLGQLDVNPLGGVPGSQNDGSRWEFSGRLIPSDNAQSVTIRIDGTSQVAGGQRNGDRRNSDGRIWEHTVTLDWEGYIDLKESRMTQLIMVAQGKERLRWDNSRFPFDREPDAAHLMAGHRINLDCGVRYGLIAQQNPNN